MSRKHGDFDWSLLNRVVDQQTTSSYKRTVNAMVLLLAARIAASSGQQSTAVPRKIKGLMILLGFTAFLVLPHQEWFYTFIH